MSAAPDSSSTTSTSPGNPSGLRGVPVAPVGAPRPLWKVFLFFLAPMLLSNILQSLSGTINNVYVGQMLGVSALAAVSSFFPVMFFFIAFIIGLGAGASVLIGQAWGARDAAKAKGGGGHHAHGRPAAGAGDRGVRWPLHDADAGHAGHAARRAGRLHALRPHHADRDARRVPVPAGHRHACAAWATPSRRC